MLRRSLNGLSGGGGSVYYHHHHPPFPSFWKKSKIVFFCRSYDPEVGYGSPVDTCIRVREKKIGVHVRVGCFLCLQRCFVIYVLYSVRRADLRGTHCMCTYDLCWTFLIHDVGLGCSLRFVKSRDGLCLLSSPLSRFPSLALTILRGA